jgi:hypothetical protein
VVLRKTTIDTHITTDCGLTLIVDFGFGFFWLFTFWVNTKKRKVSWARVQLSPADFFGQIRVLPRTSQVRVQLPAATQSQIAFVRVQVLLELVRPGFNSLWLRRLRQSRSRVQFPTTTFQKQFYRVPSLKKLVSVPSLKKLVMGSSFVTKFFCELYQVPSIKQLLMGSSLVTNIFCQS